MDTDVLLGGMLIMCCIPVYVYPSCRLLVLCVVQCAVGVIPHYNFCLDGDR